MFFTKKNSSRELREAYRAIEVIQTAETPREADILTGYAIGIIEEKLNNGKLTRAIADAIEEMAEAVGEEVRRELIEERHAGEMWNKKGTILRIEQFQEVTEG